MRAILAQRSEYSLEYVRTFYLPRPNSQLQRTRRGWESLFHLEHSDPNGWIVENRDTSNFVNGFFEQLQPLASFARRGKLVVESPWILVACSELTSPVIERTAFCLKRLDRRFQPIFLPKLYHAVSILCLLADPDQET